MSSGDSVCNGDSKGDLSRTAGDQEPGDQEQQSPHPRSDDDGLEALKHRLDGQGGIHTAAGQHGGHTGQRAGPVPSTKGCISPEVQNGVGDGGGPVVKGLNDNGEAWWMRRPGSLTVVTPDIHHPGTELP